MQWNVLEEVGHQTEQKRNNQTKQKLVIHKTAHFLAFPDTTLCTTSCTILDQILDYVFERLTRVPDVVPASLELCKEPEGDKWKNALDQHPEILYEVGFAVK